MGWAEDARQERRAPIGLYDPERYTVTVYDSFQRYKLLLAAHTIANGMTIPQLYQYAMDYVFDHHRDLKHLRRVFRKGAREIRAAVAEPIGPEFMEPRSEKQRRREAALRRFAAWAGPELFPPKKVEWP
jgi:hypothetical protein